MTKADALEILLKDHKELKNMFEEFRNYGMKTGKGALVEDICTELENHATIEEEIFYPAVRKEVDEVGSMIDQSIIEHANVKEMVSEIQDMSEDDEGYDEKVEQVITDTLYHVASEEEDLFPLVRKSKINLEELGERMRERKEELVGEMDEASW